MDQEMMQKNISVRTLGNSQKNVLVMVGIMMVVVLGFLYLGGLLHLYAPTVGITESGDRLFPAVVMQRLPEAVQVVFLIALISALFPSADGALTALTSSFCVDILRLRDRRDLSEEAQARVRKRVHLVFAALFFALVLAFESLGNPSMIVVLLTIAAYSYGPLLGLFAFAIFTRRRPADRWVPFVAITAPLVCYAVAHYQEALFGAYRIGLEILVLNGALCFAGLWLISRKPAAGRA
jgi:Na+/proline symporter